MVPLCAFVVADALTRTAAQNVEAFRKATVARDFPWFERTLAPDYVQILGPSKLDRKTALATMRKGLTKSPLASLTARIVKTKTLAGDIVATAAFRGTMKGTGNGQPMTLIATWRDDQTWTKAKGRWLLRSTRTYGFERSVETP